MDLKEKYLHQSLNGLKIATGVLLVAYGFTEGMEWYRITCIILGVMLLSNTD